MKEGLPNGEGVFVSEDKHFKYEGNWKNGKFNGKGTIYYTGSNMEHTYRSW
ncbi:MAG: hypothetical protein NC347_02890 [Clostridium sp.]|nr:hypothetical protein [Clostridium sp.]